MTKTAIINAQGAQIEERSITIKVLTIGKRQITQALYRQMPEEKLVTEDGIVRSGAIVWGKVNVCVPICKHLSDSHVHLIWEYDGELYRSRVSAKFGSQKYERLAFDASHAYTINNREKAVELDRQKESLMLQYAETYADLATSEQLYIAVSGVWE